ncbi:MAG: efflux RND transporter periplasmic adaptor subunit, partial [Candidatus Omnitrophica bacterium]|nr:efflux RND transporter periplasmic adaptor subunit [Candidatus Omnitrophota bacterium]
NGFDMGETENRDPDAGKPREEGSFPEERKPEEPVVDPEGEDPGIGAFLNKLFVVAGGILTRVKWDPEKVKKNYIWIVLGVLLVALVLARTAGEIKNIITGIRGKEEKEMVEFVETIPVKVYTVKRMDFKDTIPVMGRIEGSREIDLKFETSGILESFNFEEGERILEGDIIASLNQREALLKLKYAALDMEKAKKILDLGGHDKIVYEQKKLEYESAKRDLEKTNIYAPADGYLGSMEKHVGSYLSPQDKIGSFVEYGKVYGVFDIIEEDSPKMELGQNLDIFLDAYPGESYSGTVDMISPVIEGRTRTQKIKVEIDNEGDLLRPGMFARAVINTYEKKDALIIPSASFKKKEQKYFVYTVHREEENAEGAEGAEGFSGEGDMGIVEEREIKIEYLTHDMAEVASGLEEGELVIRELHREYKDKDKVEITEVQEETIF